MTLSAQKNLLEGYIVNKDNDTIYGKIDFNSTQINQMQCLFFSQETESKSQIFYPDEIKEYRFLNDGKYYISKIIEIDNKTIPTFVEYLVEGRLNLYYYEHTNNLPYFIFEETGKDKYYVTQKPAEEVTLGYKVDYKYVGMLRQYFGENITPAISELLDKPVFTQRYMQKIVKLYNDENCSPESASCVVFINKKPDSEYLRADFSVYAGVTCIPDLDGEAFPEVGAEVFLYKPRWSQNLGGMIDLSFSYLPDNYTNSKYLTSTLKGGLRYIYRKPRIRPTIDVGLIFYSIYNSRDEADNFLKMIVETGNYLGAGLEYAINQKHSVYIRCNYDTYNGFFFGLGKIEGLDKLHFWHVKLGFSF